MDFFFYVCFHFALFLETVFIAIVLLYHFDCYPLTVFYTNKLPGEPMSMRYGDSERGQGNIFFNQTMFALYGFIILFSARQMCAAVLSPNFKPILFPFFVNTYLLIYTNIRTPSFQHVNPHLLSLSLFLSFYSHFPFLSCIHNKPTYGLIQKYL